MDQGICGFPSRLSHEAFPRGFPTGLSHVATWCESILCLKVETVQGKQVSLKCRVSPVLTPRCSQLILLKTLLVGNCSWAPGPFAFLISSLLQPRVPESTDPGATFPPRATERQKALWPQLCFPAQQESNAQKDPVAMTAENKLPTCPPGFSPWRGARCWLGSSRHPLCK